MKKIIYYIIGAAALLAAASCEMSMDLNEPVVNEVQALTLNFTTGTMATRADGEVRNYENMVRRIDYFIFAYEDGKVPQDAEYAYKGTITPAEGDEQFAIRYTESIPAGNLNKIFPNGNTKAAIFAVANYVDYYGSNPDIEPNIELPANAKTWEDLHALEVGATFFYDDHDPNFLLRWPRKMNPQCDSLSFVMVADSVEVALQTSGSYAIDAEIPLSRLASKVTVDFTYETVVEEKESGNITWVPQPSGAETRVYLSNAIEHTTLGGPLTRNLVEDAWATATKPLGDGTRDIFEYAYDFMNTVPEVSGKKTAHYYTYPISLKEGDSNQPYLKLVLPWYGYKWVGEGTAPATVDPTNNAWQMYKQKEVYYKIVLPRGTIDKPNYIYEYHVNVNIIGSDKEIMINGEYEVLDWTTKDPVSSNVATGRYISLDIPKDEYDMYVDQINIAFVSSGTVIPIVKEIYQWNYSGSTPSKDYFMRNNEVTATTTLLNKKGVTAAQVEKWVTIPENTAYLQINHKMCNDINVTPITKFDAAPYVYVVTLHLEAAGNDTSFDRTITVTQYPSMYIKAETNSDYLGNNNHYGYVYIHNQQNINTNDWYRVTGLSGNNSNPNMFVITSTILSDPNMILGDPRKTTVQNSYAANGNNTWSALANNMYSSTQRRLSYYYPTDESDAAKNIVSPKFRIASSYGKTGSVSRQEAWQRCASYQEDGYPAGRWRIPTSAEVAYVVNLSANGFMDILFGDPKTQNSDVPYWTASGYVVVNNYTQTVSSHEGDNDEQTWVRCVYDDWYWSDKAPAKDSFIWGDKLR